MPEWVTIPGLELQGPPGQDGEQGPQGEQGEQGEPGVDAVTPTLAAVATSGQYDDLDGRPALAPVATTGSYGDLDDQPTIPASYAELDGIVPPSALPGIAIVDWLGEVGSQAAMLALSGERGDWCTRTDTATDWILIADTPGVLASWREKQLPQSPVTSVNGRTGSVSGLAEAAALDQRVPTTRQVSAGAGLTGGGTLAADRTLAVAYGSSADTAVQGSQRGPLGGVVALGAIASGSTVTPNGALGFQFAGTAAAGGFALAAASGMTPGQVYGAFITATGGNRTVTWGAGITPLKALAALYPTGFAITSGKIAVFLFRAKTATTATLLHADEEV